MGSFYFPLLTKYALLLKCKNKYMQKKITFHTEILKTDKTSLEKNPNCRSYTQSLVSHF